MNIPLLEDEKEVQTLLKQGGKLSQEQGQVQARFEARLRLALIKVGAIVPSEPRQKGSKV